MIIDGHVHVWPDRIAERALATPVEGLHRFGTGKVEDAVRVYEEAGIDHAVCLAVADTPERLEAADRFVGTLESDRLIGFGSVHPDRSPEDHVRLLREYGLRGVKVHPLFQGYSLDDPKLWEVFAALEGEFAVVAHVGEGDVDGAGDACTPKMIAEIHRNFPKLDLVAAHFGGYKVMEQAEEHVIGLPVYIDTSWPPSSGTIDRDRVRSLIQRHGADRVVFATDWPMADPAAELESIRSLGLADDELDAVLGENFARMIGLM